MQRAIEALELALLRGTRPQPGSKGLVEDFARFRGELAKLRSKRESHRSTGRSSGRGCTDWQLDRAANADRCAAESARADGRPVAGASL